MKAFKFYSLLTLALLYSCGNEEPKPVPVQDTPEPDTSGFSNVRLNSNVQNGIGIQGYDPVSYILLGIAQKGNVAITSTFDDITYYFQNGNNKTRFEANPERYIPAYGGWCAAGMAFELINPNWPSGKYRIDPESFKVIKGKTYLFYNFPDYQALPDWNRDEDRLKAFADEFWANLVK